jgi:hypothetical protein
VDHDHKGGHGHDHGHDHGATGACGAAAAVDKGEHDHDHDHDHGHGHGHDHHHAEQEACCSSPSSASAPSAAPALAADAGVQLIDASENSLTLTWPKVPKALKYELEWRPGAAAASAGEVRVPWAGGIFQRRRVCLGPTETLSALPARAYARAPGPKASHWGLTLF